MAQQSMHHERSRRVLSTGRFAVANGGVMSTYTLVTPGTYAGGLTERDAGSTGRIAAQGSGSIVQDNGLVIIDAQGNLVVHGPHDQLSGANVHDLLCNALAT